METDLCSARPPHTGIRQQERGKAPAGGRPAHPVVSAADRRDALSYVVGVLVAELETEQAPVPANQELAMRFGQKLQTKLSEIWGTPPAEPA